MHLSMPQLAEKLGLQVTAASIEKWEKNQKRPTTKHRNQIVQFLGFDPEHVKLTGVH
jgi:transcriptional regulator with XRE-family HTH domain